MSSKNTITITAPNPKYNGVSAGVRFADGTAKIEVPRQQAALEYFARHRFGISEAVPAPKGEDDLLAVPAVKLDPDAEAKAKAKAPAKGGKASAQPAPGEPAKGAGDGPIGPQHNSGQDGANPGGETPQTTPIDAGI